MKTKNQSKTTDAERTAHTPGLWEIIQLPSGALMIDSVKKIGSIATLHGGNDQTVVANARLIAAAPELLVSARRVLELWDNGGNPAGTFQLLRDAIAKAEGGDK